jgi:hypothetical protein
MVGRRVRITTPKDLPRGHAPRGQDVLVELVCDDGTVIPLHNVVSLSVSCRSQRLVATLDMVHVELDVELPEGCVDMTDAIEGTPRRG